METCWEQGNSPAVWAAAAWDAVHPRFLPLGRWATAAIHRSLAVLDGKQRHRQHEIIKPETGNPNTVRRNAQSQRTRLIYPDLPLRLTTRLIGFGHLLTGRSRGAGPIKGNLSELSSTKTPGSHPRSLQTAVRIQGSTAILRPALYYPHTRLRSGPCQSKRQARLNKGTKEPAATHRTCISKKQKLSLKG